MLGNLNFTSFVDLIHKCFSVVKSRARNTGIQFNIYTSETLKYKFLARKLSY